MHFSHPMTMLALCEVTRTPATHDSVIRSVVAFLKSVQCTPVVLEKEVFAHLCNRVLLLLADEALRLVEDGCASVEDVDAAFKVGLGFPFGPFEMIDNTGLDVVSEMLREGTNHELTRPPPAILAEKIRAGDLGRKTGRGFWTYERSGG
jgi:3-hydroxybutyryl-CoA dehydrogenase